MLGLLFARILPFLFAASFHAVHISYGEITVTRDAIRGEVSFYKDDWFNATERWCGHTLNSLGKQERERIQLEYLKAHLRLWGDGFQHPLTLAASVKSDSGLSIIYNVAATTGMAHTLTIDSRAVFSEYSDQMNIMTVKTNGKSSSVIFTSDHQTETIKL